MPSYSSYSPGTHSVTVAAYSTNVIFSVGGASGGGSASSSGGWYHSRGGHGRSGNFRLSTRSYDYTLYFYLGSQGGFGQGPANPGGSGGGSPIASGGNGHRSGGGGGGASGVYDTGLNRYTVIVGGGGGAGRFDNNTGYPGYYTMGRGIGGGGTGGGISGRNGGNAPAGHRGGGGGGSSTGGAGGLGGATTTNGYAGIGGNSAWYNNTTYYDWTYNSGYANLGNGFFTASFSYAPPNIQYFTISPSQFVQGSNATLSYQINGNVSSVSLTDFNGNRPTTASVTVSPLNDRTYTLSANGPGGNASQSVTADVLVPPVANITTDASNNTIIQGQSANLIYTIGGDVSTAQITPGIGGVNIASTPIQVSPTITTTYTLTASHPASGQDSDQVTINVITPPVVTLTAPLSVDYGNDVVLLAESENSSVSLQLLAKYYYADGTSSNYELVEDLPIATIVDHEVVHTPTYNNIGPINIEYKLYGIGQGSLTDEDYQTINVIIDRMPDPITVPESDEKFIDQQPVISPDVEITSEQIVIDDIDIPVEIKADYPIQVEIGDSGIYVDIREI
tara:strand:- start:19989 stop:21677 length:1689 start_codon:yes stop_codon:yes gene_type:complete